MSMDLNSVFGVYEKALSVHERRTDLLANNIANQDTPHFKAKDIDFRDALLKEKNSISNSTGAVGADKTHAMHIALQKAQYANQEQYRIPASSSMDDNTVDPQMEIAQFSENALRYQANLNFIDGNISMMLLAFKGE